MNKLICLILLLPLSLHAQETMPEPDPSSSEMIAPVQVEAPPAPAEDPQSHEVSPELSATPESNSTEPQTPQVDPGTPTMVETSTEDYTFINPYKSHWIATFGFEGMEYELPWQYVGDKQKINEERRKLYGGRIGIGRELHLFKGFMTSLRVEGYYMGTLFESAKTADPELTDEDVATIKDVGSIYGVDGVMSLSYIFDFRTKNPFMDQMTYMYLEPFIEAGIGRARAYNAKKYNYDTTVVQEEYNSRITDDITNARIGAGIILTSNVGYFLYLRATQNRYDITDRKSAGYQYTDSARTRVPLDGTSKDVDMDPVMVYAIGGGYKF